MGGTNDRYFRAFDAADGKVLWQFRTGSGVIGVPVTFQVDGKQYIAVQSGWGSILRACRRASISCALINTPTYRKVAQSGSSRCNRVAQVELGAANASAPLQAERFTEAPGIRGAQGSHIQLWSQLPFGGPPSCRIAYPALSAGGRRSGSDTRDRNQMTAMVLTPASIPVPRMTGIGASPPLPRVPMKVPLANP